MKINIYRENLQIFPENVAEELYLRTVLNLAEAGDEALVTMINHKGPAPSAFRLILTPARATVPQELPGVGNRERPGRWA